MARAIPAGGQVVRTDEDAPGLLAPGAVRLELAALALGLASIAVWTFGQEVVRTASGVGWLAPAVWTVVVWTVIVGAGIAGAFAGPAVDRLGVRTSWTLPMVLLAAGTGGLAAGAALRPGRSRRRRRPRPGRAVRTAAA